MPIQSIVIICLPCPKCEQAKKAVEDTIREIEETNKIKMSYEFKYTPNLREADKYSVGIAKTPIIVINGRVELAGQLTPEIIRSKLMYMHKY